MSAQGVVRKAVAAVAIATTLLGMGAGAAMAAKPTVNIDAVEVTPGIAELTITTADLPQDVTLDSADVTVTADDAALPARVSPQTRSTVAAEAPSRAVILVLDVSGSMSAAGIAAARQAALDYAGALPDDVRVGLITFADKPVLAIKPTDDRAALSGALTSLTAGGETALYDAVTLGVAAMDSYNGPDRRRLVVLSDGVDTSSVATLPDSTELLTRENVPADVVAFQYGEGGTSAVERLAASHGGRVLTADDAAQLSAAFTAIAGRFTERGSVVVDVPAELAGKSVELTVRVSSAAGTFSASEQVTFAVGSPVADGGTDESGLLAWLPQWTWQLWVLAGLTFAALLAFALVLFGFGRKEDSGKRVLDQIARYGTGWNGTGSAQREESSFARAAVGWTEGVLRARGWEDKLAERLDLAAIKLKPAEWTLLRGCASVVLTGVLLLLGAHFLVAVMLGVALGWVGTLLVVNIRISRRRAAFADQLPDVLQLVAGSLKSGFSLSQSLDAVVRENTQPAAGEISRALAEARIGVELERALDHVAYRMASDDLKWIVMAIRIQREVGGNLAEVLLTTVGTMRERAQTRRQVRALSAEGRLSAYVLLGLPFVMGAYFVVVRGEYLQPLYTTLIGVLMLVGAAVFMVLGSFWMSRLVKVEV